MKKIKNTIFWEQFGHRLSFIVSSMKANLLFVFLFLLIAAFKEGGDVLFSIPKGWEKPTYDFSKNPLTKEKIELGRRLFFDPILSKDNSISCASCHLPQLAFAHIDHELSHGISNRIGTRNSLAIMNVAWSKSFMWDGAVNHLDMQALAPISNHDEMDETLENVVAKLQKNSTYRHDFREAFGDTLITGERMLKAMSQFELTLVSANSKYDKVQRKETIFSESEGKGYELFKQNCASCHREPLFTNQSFENNGLAPDDFLKDIGRMKITKNKEDSLKFKVPTLRNIEVTYPYMHDGRYPNLAMVLFHYTENIHKSPTLAKQFRKKMILSESDKNNIISFLKTLTDEGFLQNEQFDFPNKRRK
jgi:cytochrome c peroxidase